MHTLIVEDNRVFEELLTAIVRNSDPGARLWKAEDLASAREALRRQPPDVAFVDCRLPDGNGLHLIASLRAANPRVVVAVCTSYDLEEYRHEAKRSGADFFLPKDKFDAEHVYAVLAKGYHRLGRTPKEGVVSAILHALQKEKAAEAFA